MSLNLFEHFLLEYYGYQKPLLSRTLLPHFEGCDIFVLIIQLVLSTLPAIFHLCSQHNLPQPRPAQSRAKDFDEVWANLLVLVRDQAAGQDQWGQALEEEAAQVQ